MMTEEQVQLLWLSLPSVSEDGLARFGIDRQIANRAGGLAWARITTAGRAFDFDHSGTPAVIQPVWRGPAPSLECGVKHPVLADLIAWRPAEPFRWCPTLHRFLQPTLKECCSPVPQCLFD